ncbi:MAG: bifunctional [glutamate--ammonia ligase]-adenylyl-L-tyrosine phosphorylase/[glutamate--ammonia-ligase] adenylyltransferase, partial [Gammaproteobacteria bacterium]|nr:bifunctional [glutamate--ammonia ligase]-adenylyl-L-tyrosine phosphorylase/[glutamate--ammonia-ligase] adenylyltransferase [Gammaproteobacteria bacterium]
YERALKALMAQTPSLEALMRELRRLRAREMVRFVWQRVMAIQDSRDISHWISEFAQVLLSATIAYLSQCHQAMYGVAMDKNDVPCILYVLGLGKLGGYDLNFSSDIDIVFTYFTPHHWQGTPKEWDPNQYFSKLAQTVVKVLSEVTAEGFVFRVDLRLRPFGQSGPVVMSYTAMEQYYQQHGREWERYALIKARILNEGPTEEKEILQSLLQRFSYRRYVDYSVIEALRKLKGLMDKQVQEDAALDDIKLGRGGLREIEFIVQTFQLLKGGKDKRLQTPSLYAAMSIISQEGWLSSAQVAQLREDYDRLRSMEDSLQMIADRQTQSYPTELLDQARLAWVMGYASWSDLLESLEPLRSRVSTQFEALFSIKGQREPAADIHTSYFFKLWSLQISFADWASQENKDATIDWTEVMATVIAFRESHTFVHLSKEARLRLDQLMPLVLAVVVQEKDPNLYLQRFLKVIAAIVRRSTYLSLLIENKNALFHLIQCCGQSVWMSEQLAQYPILLDSLLDSRLSLLSLDQIGLENRLEQALLATPEADTEAQLEILRQIKNEYTLQAAMAYLTAQWDDDGLSNHLSEVAVAFLNVVARLAWRWVRNKYKIQDLNDAILPPWAIVAYGTLGGREMGFQSDLDLVFLYNNGAEQGLNAAEQQQRAEYSYQWARRVVYWLELKTYNGHLYKVDTQLRPSGQAGLLVSDITHFQAYQMVQAWLWEHQALLRARVVASNGQMAAQFAAIRQLALARDRDINSLKQEIVAMRQRMLSHTASCPAGKFDLKQG